MKRIGTYPGLPAAVIDQRKHRSRDRAIITAAGYRHTSSSDHARLVSNRGGDFGAAQIDACDHRELAPAPDARTACESRPGSACKVMPSLKRMARAPRPGG